MICQFCNKPIHEGQAAPELLAAAEEWLAILVELERFSLKGLAFQLAPGVRES
jgi:hypothetical protein